MTPPLCEQFFQWEEIEKTASKPPVTSKKPLLKILAKPPGKLRLRPMSAADEFTDSARFLPGRASIRSGIPAFQNLHVLLFAIISCASGLVAEEPERINEFREWKSTHGTVVNARLDGFKTKSIIKLIKDDGKEIEVDRGALSEEDGKYLDGIWYVYNPIIIYDYPPGDLKSMADASNIRVEIDSFNSNFLWLDHTRNQDFSIDALATRFGNKNSAEPPVLLVRQAIHLAVRPKIKNDFFRGARRVRKKNGLESIKIVYVEHYISPKGFPLGPNDGQGSSMIPRDELIQHVDEFAMEISRIPEVQFSPAARVDRTISDHVVEWKFISRTRDSEFDFIRKVLMNATTMTTITRTKPDLVRFKKMPRQQNLC